jgi:hypothetical protein
MVTSSAKFILALLLSLVASTAIVLAYGKFVPQTYSSPELEALHGKMKTRGYLTKEELEEMQRQSDLIHQEVRRRLAQEDRSLWFSDLRHRALLVSWVPWAVLGLMAVRSGLVVWMTTAALLLLSAVGVLSLWEAVAFSAATLVAFLGRRLARAVVKGSGHSTGPAH